MEYLELFEINKQYWLEKENIAKENMKFHLKNESHILIEVASQHPLIDGIYPNDEFKARLDKAIEIYNYYLSQGINVSIYVPGSIHKYNEVIDKISLSKAGISYLLEKNIPLSALKGEGINLLYKGEDGVYNAADECYCTSKLFLENNYSNLICVCSTNQIPRKSLFYIEFGVVAQFVNIFTEKMFHDNYIEEIFGSFSNVLYFDHSWQDKDSFIFKECRKERKP
jgi:hypothetical protein